MDEMKTNNSNLELPGISNKQAEDIIDWFEDFDTFCNKYTS
jgi:hypothetical protein